MSKKNIISFIIICTVFFVSCSKKTDIEKFISSNNDDVFSIKESQVHNDYYVWYYCEDYETVSKFLKDYGFHDIDDWTVSETHLYTDKLKETSQENLDKELKTGYYVLMEYFFDNESMNAHEIKSEVFYNDFETIVKAKMPSSIINSALSKELYTGVHKINKKFYSFDNILYHSDPYVGYYCKSEKDLFNVLKKYGLEKDFNIDKISKLKGIEYEEDIYDEAETLLSWDGDYIKSNYKTGFYINIAESNNTVFSLGFLDFNKQPEITNNKKRFSFENNYLNINTSWIYDY